jgi:hypothetical protein
VEKSIDPAATVGAGACGAELVRRRRGCTVTGDDATRGDLGEEQEEGMLRPWCPLATAWPAGSFGGCSGSTMFCVELPEPPELPVDGAGTAGSAGSGSSGREGGPVLGDSVGAGALKEFSALACPPRTTAAAVTGAAGVTGVAAISPKPSGAAESTALAAAACFTDGAALLLRP